MFALQSRQRPVSPAAIYLVAPVNNAVGAFADSERIAPQHRADTVNSTVALTSSAGVLQVSRVRLPRRQEFL